MPDYWPHLNAIHEARGRAYAELIGMDAKDAYIVDLNCGKAPVFLYVASYASYYGNDNQPDFILELQSLSKERPATFEFKNDIDVIVDRCDVLMLLGSGAHSLNGGPSVESRNDFTTFIRLMNEHKPKILILEFVLELTKETGYQSAIAPIMSDIQKAGYSEEKKLDITFGQGSYMRRVAWKWRRN